MQSREEEPFIYQARRFHHPQREGCACTSDDVWQWDEWPIELITTLIASKARPTHATRHHGIGTSSAVSPAVRIHDSLLSRKSRARRTSSRHRAPCHGANTPHPSSALYGAVVGNTKSVPVGPLADDAVARQRGDGARVVWIRRATVGGPRSPGNRCLNRQGKWMAARSVG